MGMVVKGTTPTFKYKAQTVDVSDVAVAYLTIKQWDTQKIQKDITSATVDTDEGTIAWKLTQTEALTLDPAQTATAYCDVRLSDGTRFAAPEITFNIGKTGKAEVI